MAGVRFWPIRPGSKEGGSLPAADPPLLLKASSDPLPHPLRRRELQAKELLHSQRCDAFRPIFRIVGIILHRLGPARKPSTGIVQMKPFRAFHTMGTFEFHRKSVHFQQRNILLLRHGTHRGRIVPVGIHEFPRAAPFPASNRRGQERHRLPLSRLLHESSQILLIGPQGSAYRSGFFSFSSLCPNWMMTKSPGRSTAITFAQRPSSRKLFVLRPFTA